VKTVWPKIFLMLPKEIQMVCNARTLNNHKIIDNLIDQENSNRNL
jgi:hypothetical protein